jgi:hypothetical protein
MSENTKLWEQVFVTDPAAVKPITGKSYRGNSPKPYWLIERATQTFGPVGIGWGVVVKSERFERLSETDVLHVAVVSVWYMWEGKRTESFDQMGGTKACYMTSKGSLMVDEDAGKKSVTDGMVKCLSMIGFAGDIFTGQWDDSKYVEWAHEQYHPTPEKQPLVRATAKPNLVDVAKSLAVISGAKDEQTLVKVWKTESPKFDAESSEYAALQRAANERRKYLRDMALTTLQDVTA